MNDTQRKWSRIIGLDLSKRTFTGCILSGENFTDREMFEGSMGQDSEGYGLIRSRIRAGDIVLMEAGSSTFNLARYLIRESSAERIVVLNPANLRIIWDSMRKTDKSDAVKIACIARDMRPEAWPTVPVPSAQEQAERSVITQHVFLKKQETQLFNRLFALYNSLGYPDIDKARLKEDSGYRMELADKLLSVSELSLLNGMMLNDQINLVQLQLENHEERLRRICLAHPRQALSWLSIPGIGLVNATRPFTVGRKNWLFNITESGETVSAFFYSLVESCKALGVNVHDYLTHLLMNANNIKDGDGDAWTALLPGECDVSDARIYRERLLEAVPDPIRTEPYRLRGKRV